MLLRFLRTTYLQIVQIYMTMLLFQKRQIPKQKLWLLIIDYPSVLNQVLHWGILAVTDYTIPLLCCHKWLNPIVVTQTVILYFSMRVLMHPRNKIVTYCAVGIHLLVALFISYNEWSILDQSNVEWALLAYDLTILIVAKHEQSEDRLEKVMQLETDFTNMEAKSIQLMTQTEFHQKGQVLIEFALREGGQILRMSSEGETSQEQAKGPTFSFDIVTQNLKSIIFNGEIINIDISMLQSLNFTFPLQSEVRQRINTWKESQQIVCADREQANRSHLTFTQLLHLLQEGEIVDPKVVSRGTSQITKTIPTIWLEFALVKVKGSEMNYLLSLRPKSISTQPSGNRTAEQDESGDMASQLYTDHESSSELSLYPASQDSRNCNFRKVESQSHRPDLSQLRVEPNPALPRVRVDSDMLIQEHIDRPQVQHVTPAFGINQSPEQENAMYQNSMEAVNHQNSDQVSSLVSSALGAIEQSYVLNQSNRPQTEHDRRPPLVNSYMEMQLMRLMMNDQGKKLKLSEDRLRMNKVFIYMVIHDLKHPTEAVIQTLRNIESKLTQQIQNNEASMKLTESFFKEILKLVDPNHDDLIEFSMNSSMSGSGVADNHSDYIEVADIVFREMSHEQSQSSNGRSLESVGEMSVVSQTMREEVQLNKAYISKFSSNKSVMQRSENFNEKIKKDFLKILYNQIDTIFRQSNQQFTELINGDQHVIKILVQNQVVGRPPTQYDSLIQKVLLNKQVLEETGQIVVGNPLQNQFQHDREKLSFDFPVPQVRQSVPANRQNQLVSQNDRFESNVSHRNSIVVPQALKILLKTKVDLFRQKLERRYSVTGKLKEQLESVQILGLNSGIMHNLMMDLLDLAQIENSTFMLNKQFFTLDEAIEQAFAVVDHCATKKNIELVPPTIQPENEHFFKKIYGDKNRFVQVIINFLSNSIKFSYHGSQVKLSVDVIEHQLIRARFDSDQSLFAPMPSSPSMIVDDERFRSFGTDVEGLINEYNDAEEHSDRTAYIHFKLNIEDFGAGIPQDKLDSIFFNFNNLEEHQRVNPTGRGLGLSICKSIVENMGGTVSVTSELGKGSIFSMSFKVMCKLDSPPALEASSDQQIQILPEIEPPFLPNLDHNSESIQDASLVDLPRLLFVNDDSFLQFSYSQQLAPYFEVDKAENGLQALQMIYSQKNDYYEAIVLDINMPIMDGFEACERIVDHFSKASCFLKSYSSPGNISAQSVPHVMTHSKPGESISFEQQKIDEQISAQEIAVAKFELFNQKSFSHPEIIEQRFPLLVAMTADESPEMAQALAQYQFNLTCSRLTQDHVNMILRAISIRRQKCSRGSSVGIDIENSPENQSFDIIPNPSLEIIRRFVFDPPLQGNASLRSVKFRDMILDVGNDSMKSDQIPRKLDNKPLYEQDNQSVQVHSISPALITFVAGKNKEQQPQQK